MFFRFSYRKSSYQLDSLQFATSFSIGNVIDIDVLLLQFIEYNNLKLINFQR